MSEIDKKLTELLKGKIVEKVETAAFPDIFIHFNDGTTLYYEFEDIVYNREIGDEKILNIHISGTENKDKFNDSIKLIYHSMARDSWKEE